MRVIGPNGGETCSGMEEITWEADAAGEEALLIDLYLSTDGGACWEQVAVDEANDGSYMMDTTACPDSDQCKMKLVGHNTSITYEDESDAVFTINNAGGGISEPVAVETEALVEPADSATGLLTLKTKLIRRVRGAARVEVLVEANNVEDLHNISFDLTFDPKTVKILDCEEGGFLKQMGETVFLPDIDNKAGRVNVGTALLGRGAGATGTGTIATITIVVKKNKMPLKPRLKNVVLQNSQMEPIP